MKRTTFVILIALFSVSHCQKSCVYYVSSAIVFSALAGYTEGLQYKENYLEKSQSEIRMLSRQWHFTQLLERGSGIVLGITIADYSKFKWEKVLASSLLSSAIFWIVYDGMINIVKNKSFFYVSGLSTSPFQNLSKPGIKISYLMVAILFQYFNG